MRCKLSRIALVLQLSVMILAAGGVGSAQAGFCVLLSKQDAADALGENFIKISADAIHLGASQMKEQSCKYQASTTKYATMMVIEATSQDEAARLFHMSVMGSTDGTGVAPKPVTGLGDQAAAVSNNLWMRKKNMYIQFQIIAQGLSDDKMVAMAKAMATKAAASIR